VVLLESPESNFHARRSGQLRKRRQLAEHYYYAALDLVLEGHHEQAVDEYRQALAADPRFTDALHGLSRALQDLNRFDEAIAVAQQISEVDPDDILAHTSLSILYQRREWFPRPKRKATKRAF